MFSSAEWKRRQIACENSDDLKHVILSVTKYNLECTMKKFSAKKILTQLFKHSMYGSVRLRKSRISQFERLEHRRVLAAAIWHNARIPVDVSNDQPALVSPLDVLLVINHLNDALREGTSGGLLPRQLDEPRTGNFVDVSCDGRVTPLDVLRVINYLNVNGSGTGGGFATEGGIYENAACSPQLLEGDNFVDEMTHVLSVPSEKGALRVLFENPAFDTTSSRQIRDAFEIEITDAAGERLALAYQSGRDAVYNWSEEHEPLYAPGTWTTTGAAGETSSFTIDLSHLPEGTDVHVSTRLVNNDSDNNSSVIIRGFEFVDVPAGGSTGTQRTTASDVAEVTPFDFRQLSDLTGSVSVEYGRTSLHGDNNKLYSEFKLTNVGSQAVIGSLIVVLENFTELDAFAMQPDGLLPDGRPFFDLTSRLEAGVLPAGETVRSRELQFLNNSGQRFTYQLKAYGKLNAAPGAFTTLPLTSIAAGSTYIYRARAVDAEQQPLSYSVVVGPEAMTIDSTTGVVGWVTTLENIGSHRVVLRATDPYGLFVEQAFEIQVIESLQNRPPNFVSDPVTDAIASSGFEITTVATGAQPAGVDVISGFRGPRLVSINAADQSVGVYAGENNDRFDDATTYSSGEPKPTDAVVDVGYSVDIGLEPFSRTGDQNEIYGMDQGDFNGDGILDLAVLTYDRPGTGGGTPHSFKIVRMLGDGNGQFGESVEVASITSGTLIYPRNLLAADMNNDGALDLMFTSSSNVQAFYFIEGNGDGSFKAMQTTSFDSDPTDSSRYSIVDFTVADMDNDGTLDLVGQYGLLDAFGFGHTLQMAWWFGNGDGTFGPTNIIGDAGSMGTSFQTRAFDVGDLNGDGLLDVVTNNSQNQGNVANSQSVFIYLANSAGTFDAPILIDPIGPAFYYDSDWMRIGDFTGDGNQDIAFVHVWHGQLMILVGDGTGTNFEEKIALEGLNSRSDNYAGSGDVVDIDADGDLDIVLTAFSNNGGIEVLLNDGAGNYSQTDYTTMDFPGAVADGIQDNLNFPAGVLVGDYNQDGVNDLSYFTQGNDFNGVGILLGTRPGEFSLSRSIPFSGGTNTSMPGDFNGDGRMDLFATVSLETYLGQGDGSFAEPIPAFNVRRPSSVASVVADFNLDGLDDVISTNSNTSGASYYVALSNGDGTFTVSDNQLLESSFYGYSAIRVTDFNNDSYPDFVAKTGVERQIDVHLNDPENPGTFTRAFRTVVTAQGVNVSSYDQGFAVGDFNNDGRVDLAYTEKLPEEPHKIVILAGDGLGSFEFLSEFSTFDDDYFRFSFYYPGDLDVGDFNEDGKLDLVNFQSVGTRVMFGNGDGSFNPQDKLYFVSEAVQGRGRDGYVVDFNSDGHLDLVEIGQGGQKIAFRLGDGTGRFAAPIQVDIEYRIAELVFADLNHDGNLDTLHTTVGQGGPGTVMFYSGMRDGLLDIHVADLNGDGNEEVLAINENNDRVKLFTGDNLDHLTRQRDLFAGRAPQAVTTADLNGDGKLEIISANRAGHSLSVFVGNVEGGYAATEFAAGKGPIDVKAADLNGDSQVDLVALDDTSNALWIYSGNGSTTLSDPIALALGDKPGSLTLADVNGDGSVDAVVVLPDSNRLMLLVGDGELNFAAPVYVDLASSASDVQVVDLNADGKSELVATLPELNVVSVLYGLGGNQFAKTQQITVGEHPTRITLADADEDGRLDLLVVNTGDDTVSVIYNRFDPNQVYRYDSDAIDPDNDTLTYSIVDGPGGLIINGQTGALLWAASPDQVGEHTVTIAADDGRGGIGTQTFKIEVQPAKENAQPLFATEPISTIGANEAFSYQATALDNDDDAIRYRLVAGPEGATIDPTTGFLTWDGRNEALQFGTKGQNGNIDVPRSDSLHAPNITIEGWFSLQELTASNSAAVLFSQPNQYGSAYYIRTLNNDKLQLIMHFDGQSLDYRVPFKSQVGVWTHLALVINSDALTASIYVDGELLGQKAIPQPVNYAAFPNSALLQIGERGSFPTKAIYDNFRIWNVVRSAAELQEGWSQRYENDTRVVLDYRFDGADTFSVHDHSVYRNDGFRVANPLYPLQVPGLSTTGSYEFSIAVEDGRGGFDEQSFTVNVVPELRGSIRGHLFADLNGDGQQNDGSEEGIVAEPSLENWLLYIDANDNSFRDPVEATATTDAEGNYSFTSLLPGSYTIKVDSVAGYQMPDPRNLEVAANPATVSDLAIEQLALSQVRGQLRTADDAIAFWKVYADLDGDGTRDDDEPMAVTDRNGNYALTDLSAGNYTLRPDLPAGWTDTAGREGLTVALAADEILADQDFVLAATNTSVSGGVHFVTMPNTSIEARQTFRYASVAMSIGNESIFYDLSLAPAGMTVDPHSGLVAWRPTLSQVGEHVVILRATSQSGSIALHDFSIEVTAPNTAPIFSTPDVYQPPGASPGFLDANAGLTYMLDVQAQDAEDDALSYSVIESPTGVTLDADTGELRWTPTEAQVGNQHFTLAVADSAGLETRTSFQVRVQADQPAATPFEITNPRTVVGLGQNYLGQIQGRDRFARSFTWSLASGPTGMIVESNGVIRWNPTQADLGSHTVELQLETADGDIQAHTFTLEVVGRPVNSAPEIRSSPLVSATIGHEYQYDIAITDADADPMSYVLIDGPIGMSVHPSLGTLRWTPSADQRSEHDVTVQVTDPDGETATQTFTLKASRSGGPPRITSTAATEAAVGVGFLYTVVAQDSEGDPLTYRLLAAPDGMSIVETTGEITWTPTAEQTGQQDVVVEVSDGVGGAATQAFAVRVSEGVPNLPPSITTVAPRFGAVGSQYKYTVAATDPELTTITYSLGQAPSGMSINANLGQVTWTPMAGQVGQFVVTIIATDAGGATAVESFQLDVLAENRAPTITSDAPNEAVSGDAFAYQVVGRDVDLDALTYTLTEAPSGATIDAFGKISWNPTTLGNFDFTVKVNDPRGGEAMQSFSVEVVADTTPPTISLVERPQNSGRNVLPWMGPFKVYARALDNVGIASLTLMANGEDIPLDAAGTATFTFEEWTFQSINATATAIDASGNVTTKTITFDYDFPEGWSGAGTEDIPTAIISSPAPAQAVFGMVVISGTAAHEKFDSYQLSYRRADEDSYTEFYNSRTAVTNGELGVWDTSMLINDEYYIRLEVATTEGIVNVAEQNVGLSGELKLGNFQLSFTDMVIPVAGIPIEITRIYDTLQADREGDFGYGWRLEYRDTDLRVGLPKSGLEDIGIYSPLHPGVKGYLNVPGQGRQGFTFDPNIRVLPGFGGNNLVLAQPRFTPDPGVTSTLGTGTSGYLQVNEFNELFAPGGIPYNPASPDFGGAYVLTTREGVTYRVDGASGKLISANDRSGNRLKFDENGISTNDRQVITMQRDQLQRIVRIAGPDDTALSYGYEGGNLVRFSDQEGFVTTYKYDAQDRLQEIVDPLARPYARTTYGPDGRLLSVTDANGRTISFTHSGETNQQIIEDANGSLTVLEYDSQGRIVQETDPLGGVLHREFDSAGRVLVEVDPSGARVINRYDARGNLISQVDRNGNIVRLSYDSQNQPISLTTAGGQTTHFRYNTAGLLTARLSDDGQALELIEYDDRGNPIRTTNAEGHTEIVEYDDAGIAVAMEDPLGRRTELMVNASGLSTGQIDANGNSMLFERDARGLVTALRGADGKLVSRRFNAAGELIGMTTPSGGQTQFAVDAIGNETLLGDANGGTQLRAYSLTGDLITLTNENGSVTRYEYDLLGRRTKTIHSDGSTEEFKYDSVGNVVQTTDPLGNVRRFEYDSEGQLVLERDSLGRETTYDYDAEGRTTKIEGPDASIIEYAYDTAGNRIRIVLPDGKVLKREFDRMGNLVAEIDPAGRTTRYDYDAAGQLTSVSAPGGGVSRYAYDANGNLIRQEDPLGNVTSFEYDVYNQLVSKTYPAGDRETYGYDIEGWQTSRTTADGETIVVYDRNGNVLEQRFADGTRESFTYSATNQVLSATNVLGTITMTYDSRDRLVVVQYPDDSQVRYSYDANGNRTSVTAVDVVGNEHQTTYRYDAVNRLLAVQDSEAGETLYEYDTADRITAVSYPNGMRAEYSFTEAGYLEVMETKLGGTTVERLHYSFGESYERSEVAWLDGRTTLYTYDAALRLTSETQLTGNQSVAFREVYSYDQVGNRRSIVHSNGDTQLLSYNANNQILKVGDREFIYDTRGRLALETGNNHRVEYSYDAEDQLVRVDHNGTVVEYMYDALGNRMAEIRNGIRTNYLLDFRQDGIHQVLAEYPVDQPFSVEYVYGHQRISHADAAGTAFFHYDASQNVIALSNLVGEITDRYVMTAFGELLDHVGTSSNPYQFASERFDSQTGLVHMRARDYAPNQGRFLSRDPFDGLLTDPTSLHRYQYAHQNPISNTDPTGEITLSEQAVVGAVIGGLTSGIGGYLGGKRGKELVFETFVGAAFGAVGGQFGGALSKAFATQFMQARVFTTILSNPVVIKYSPRLVHAVPNTVLGISEDLTKGFGTGSYKDPGFAGSVAFNAGANFFFNILVGPGQIGLMEIQRAVPTGRRLAGSGIATYEIFTRAAREEAAPSFKEMVTFFGDGNFTRYEELFLQFLNDTTKFLVSQVISLHSS